MATDLVHFRKRIGEEGVEKLLKHSIELHGKDAKDNHVSVDLLSRKRASIYPTDEKLHKKIVDSCISIAKKEGIKLRRSYVRTTKNLVRDTYNGTHPKRSKQMQRSESLKPLLVG